LSVEAVQERLISEDETAVALNPVGTEGGVVSVVLFTVIGTGALVAWLFDVSIAVAVKTCWPLATDIVLADAEYGDEVMAEPNFAPSRLNWTLAIPTLLDAEAAMVTIPDTVSCEVGAVTTTVGDADPLPVLVRGVMSHLGSNANPYPALVSAQHG
jgi:hypothetical protein